MSDWILSAYGILISTQYIFAHVNFIIYIYIYNALIIFLDRNINVYFHDSYNQFNFSWNWSPPVWSNWVMWEINNSLSRIFVLYIFQFIHDNIFLRVLNQ